MALSAVITLVAMVLELVIRVLGIYAGYAKKKTYGYLFAVTFRLFALRVRPGAPRVYALVPDCDHTSSFPSRMTSRTSRSKSSRRLRWLVMATCRYFLPRILTVEGTAIPCS
jgi:hypothetical protein